MADLKLRGGGSTEEVARKTFFKTKVNSIHVTLNIVLYSEKYFQVSALEHFLRVDGWRSHSLLPQGWKIRLKRFFFFFFSPLFNLIGYLKKG